jgi:hypothetical protein
MFKLISGIVFIALLIVAFYVYKRYKKTGKFVSDDNGNNIPDSIDDAIEDFKVIKDLFNKKNKQ